MRIIDTENTTKKITHTQSQVYMSYYRCQRTLFTSSQSDRNLVLYFESMSQSTSDLTFDECCVRDCLHFFPTVVLFVFVFIYFMFVIFCNSFMCVRCTQSLCCLQMFDIIVLFHIYKELRTTIL